MTVERDVTCLIGKNESTPAATPPASVLADLTGISISTAERWSE